MNTGIVRRVQSRQGCAKYSASSLLDRPLAQLMNRSIAVIALLICLLLSEFGPRLAMAAATDAVLARDSEGTPQGLSATPIDGGFATERRDLHHPPLATQRPEITWRDLWQQPRYSTITVLIASLASALLLLGLLLRNRQLRDARQAAIDTEQRWLSALDAASDGVWDWNPQTGKMLFSDQWKRMFGSDYDQIGDSFEDWSSRIHSDDLPLAIHNLHLHLDANTASYRSMHRLRDTQGSWRWTLDRGMVFVRDAQGNALRMIGTTTDITPLRRTEAALLAEQELFAAVVSQASDGVVVIDTENLHFIQFNETACHGLGYDRDEFAAITLADIQAEQSADQVHERIAEIVAEGHARFDTTHRHKDGSLRNVLVSSQVILRDEHTYLAATWMDITDRLATERALRDSETRLRATFEYAAVGIAHVALDGRWLRINRRLCEILGYTREELLMRTFQDITDAGDLDADLALVQRCMDGEIDHYHREKRYVLKDGSRLWVDLSVALVRREDGSPDYFISVIDDIDQRKRDQVQLEKANSLYRGLIEHMHDGVAIYHAVDNGEDFIFTEINPAGARSVRIEAEALVGLRVSNLFPQIDAIGLLEVFRKVYRSGQPQSHQITYYQDERIAIWVENDVFKLPTGELVAIFTDVTEQKKAEAALRESQATLERIAYYDPLTGLANRHMLLDRLRQVTAVADRNGTSVAVCYLNLDHFKPINDQLGHAIGDALLQSVAQRIGSAIHACDTASRWGGDEFALLLTGLQDSHECEVTIARLLQEINAPYLVDGYELSVSASIGVTLYPKDRSDSDTLLRHADQAMYEAKQLGRNTYHCFDPDTENLADLKHDRLQQIHQALDRDELRLFYQPILNMRHSHLEGIEALLRWQHPQEGLLLPGAFLPLVEGDDLMQQIDLWVIRRAMKDLADWVALGHLFRIHMNVSAQTLAEKDFLDTVQQELHQHRRIDIDQIAFEIPETVALHDLEAITEVIRRGNALGLRFALDDFGTGISSLTYFRHLPAQILKIEQGFVHDMLRNKEDLSIVEAVIGLSRAFERQVIGEGVESEAHGMMLLRFGCELGQGFGIAHPMPREQVVAWLESYSQPRQWRSVAAHAWLPEDLPLLTMEAEHRGWIESVLEQTASHPTERSASDSSVSADAQFDPNLALSQCRFGHWYAQEGQLRYGHMPLFRDMAPLHQRVHDIVQELLQTRARGEMPDQELFEQLNSASNALLDRLTMLQNAVVDANGKEMTGDQGFPIDARDTSILEDGAPDWARLDH